MESLIHLLPDTLANQIAAGEVVQRPASVVKELLENAIDAGATRVELSVKDAGRTLIQVLDNGNGMSAQDARMCFERHATSKIKKQDDLFNILTFGFRGEALASIAAVAQVRLRTRRAEAEIATEIDIEGGETKRVAQAVAPIGTTFYVRNLFFNVPARRNFLKSNAVEMRHVLTEFVRIALPNPQVAMQLMRDETTVFNLPAEQPEARIVELFGKELKGKLLPIGESSDYVRVSGYVGSPDVFRKERGEQFIFVNNRFIKHSYLDHAITSAFQEIIPQKTFPFYCIFLEIAPIHVDINIHPTKTEVKFDDERAIYAVLRLAVARAVGSSNLFNGNTSSTATPQQPSTAAKAFGAFRQEQPTQEGAPKSPFATPFSQPRKDSGVQLPPKHIGTEPRQPVKPSDWQPLYQPLAAASPATELPFTSTDNQPIGCMAWQNFVVTQHKGDLLLVHIQRAQQRVSYEALLEVREGVAIGSQQLLFPETVEISPADMETARQALPLLHRMGFDLQEFGATTLAVRGVPPETDSAHLREVLEAMLADIRLHGFAEDQTAERIAKETAMRMIGKMAVNDSSLKILLTLLFRCEQPAFSPMGKPTFRRISAAEAESWMA